MSSMTDRHCLQDDTVTSLPNEDERLLGRALAAALGVSLRAWPEASLRRRDLQRPRGERQVESVVLDQRGVILARGVIKSGLTERAWRLLPALDALRREHQLTIPAIYARQRRSSLALMEWIDGRSLDILIQTGSGLPAAERAGAAVATLHSAPAAQFELLTLERLLDDLHPAPGDLPGNLGWRGAILSRAIDAMPDPVARQAGLCHRDLHPRQLLDDGERVVIVDLDQIGRGHPALDLANFSAYLAARLPDHCVAVEASFLKGYAARSRGYVPGDDLAAETIYRAFTFLRLAVKAFRMAEPGWESRANALLDCCQRLLGLEAHA